MPWWRYVVMLTGMRIAGVIEPGFYWWSLRRGATYVRTPWTKKRSEEMVA